MGSAYSNLFIFRCECTTSHVLSHSNASNASLRQCYEYDGTNVGQVIQDVNCTSNVKYFLAGLFEEQCTCYWLCDDYMYNKVVSTADWPRGDVMDDFVQNYVNKGVNNSAHRTYSLFQKMFAKNSSEEREMDEFEMYYMTRDGKIKEIHVSEGDRLFLEEVANISRSYTPKATFPPTLMESWKDSSLFR